MWVQTDRRDLMDIDVFEHHLAGGVVIASVLGCLGIVASINSNIGLLGINIAPDEYANATGLSSNDETALG